MTAMPVPKFPSALLTVLFISLGVFYASAEGKLSARPNIIVIVSDDAGYADFSFHGSKEVSTPHLDALAARGVRFSNGYVTGSVCSPSRAGLMTGRYQQRFGHETNLPNRGAEGLGLPLTETTLGKVLKGVGYHTVAMGKWHLGEDAPFQPIARGFDEFYGFLGGARPYWPIDKKLPVEQELLRSSKPVQESFKYLTDDFAREAVEVIGKIEDAPLFLYLAFNAVHSPMHAREDILAGLMEIKDEKRRKLVAMTLSLDHAVGLILKKIDECGIAENTMLFFINDNGGAIDNASGNLPLRGHKRTPFEGGVRVPFIVSWPSVLPQGEIYDKPVSALDIFATSARVAGVKADVVTALQLDGVDLIPFLTAKNSDNPHQILYWRRGGGNMAIRDGDWKLVRYKGSDPMLFNLANDPNEKKDLAGEQPDRSKLLLKKYNSWSQQMIDPAW